MFETKSTCGPAYQHPHLSERVLKYGSNNEDPEGLNPTVEDAATVEYELFDGDVKVGQTKGVGRMLYKRDDGAFVAYFSEVITLTDGTVIRTGGLVDDSRLTAGEQATIQAVGVAGKFKGAVGFRQFRPG
ncbi:2-keto-4-pentenoate hydratase/2-oxohepta-3-ene-1,7-dioic acid hydratase in catechol pathway [Rhodococcus sp. 27YEA15]|uniref:allene oxide cyclase barrel-like domain-containing protein n=1 Tax=Rhodococcus sp. 27YEA15 TaxID=3156259 RepID=UPI003C7B8B7C